MTEEYEKYINALRQCAKEHKNDITFTGHIITSDLCSDTANLLENIAQEQKDMVWDVIKALKAEPREDCVSREFMYKLGAKCIAARDENGELIAITSIESLPPVTPKQRWIPVDYDRYPETYPKPFQEVWITDAYSKVYHEAYDGTRSIKAWMPYIIPEPYKEGESE